MTPCAVPIRSSTRFVLHANGTRGRGLHGLGLGIAREKETVGAGEAPGDLHGAIVDLQTLLVDAAGEMGSEGIGPPGLAA